MRSTDWLRTLSGPRQAVRGIITAKRRALGGEEVDLGREMVQLPVERNECRRQGDGLRGVDGEDVGGSGAKRGHAQLSHGEQVVAGDVEVGWVESVEHL